MADVTRVPPRMTVARMTRLYFLMLRLHLQALLEYKSDFWIMAGATVLMQVVNIAFLSAIFAQVPAVRGWPLWSVVALFALTAIAEGVGSFLFEGTWRIADQINRGALDYMMVRPYPVVLQVTSSEIGINGLTNITIGGIMLALALPRMDVHWTAATVGWSLLLLVSALAIKVGINLATNSVSFWLGSPEPYFAMAVHQVGDMSRFPLTIYPSALKAVIGFAIPFGFITTFPVSFLTGIGSTPWLGMIAPLVAVYCVIGALLIFGRGLRRYESAGN